MKRFLIPLLLALSLPSTVQANWFGYRSRFEAFEACKSWKSKKTNALFMCRDEKETNQIIGLKDFKVIKRFKY